MPRVGPPIRRIATASALSTEPIGAITSVRELPDGRVLLSDGTRLRLVLLDTMLKTTAVVLDSLAEVENTYGTRAGVLIPFRGDSTLFVDPASYALIVIDPAGKVARVRSVWRVQDIFAYTNASGSFGLPGVDGRGRIVYRISAQPARSFAPPSTPGSLPYFPTDPDSAFVVAVDLDTRKLDTLGTVRVPSSKLVTQRTPDGGFTVYSETNPLPTGDAWAVRSDGVVAFVRTRDYRLDLLHPDGRWTSSPKIPFDWQRLTEEDKQRLVDSVRTAEQRAAMTGYVSSMIRWVNQWKRSYPAGFTAPAGFAVPTGLPKGALLPPGMAFPPTYVYACAPGEEPTIVPPAGARPGAPPGAGAGAPPTPAGAASPGGPSGVAPGAPGAMTGTPSCIPLPTVSTGTQVPPPPTLRQPLVVSPSALPDYRPPMPAFGAARADADGNLWIRTVPPKPIPGGLVYDIVSAAGELVDRVQLPPGYTLVGFGRGKVVFLSMRDAKGLHLARVRLK